MVVVVCVLYRPQIPVRFTHAHHENKDLGKRSGSQGERRILILGTINQKGPIWMCEPKFSGIITLR